MKMEQKMGGLRNDYKYIQTMLRKNGDFLVRTSEPKPGEPRMCVLSVMVTQELEENGIKHFVIREKPDGVGIEKQTFPNVRDLINHHISSKVRD